MDMNPTTKRNVPTYEKKIIRIFVAMYKNEMQRKILDKHIW